jgi:hypothetical protein
MSEWISPVRPELLPSARVLVNYSEIIVSFNTVKPELVTILLNIP